MQFRNRAKVIQVIRSGTDPATGQPRSQVVGAITKPAMQWRPTAGMEVSAAERLEIERFIEEVAETRQLRKKLTAHELPDLVEAVVDYYGTLPEGPERDRLRAHIGFAVQALRQATR